MILTLLAACGPIALDGAGDSVADSAPTRSYELGWPVDACADDLDEAGTGHKEGDILPQYELLAQTGERVRLHDFCNRAVYIEFGYFT